MVVDNDVAELIANAKAVSIGMIKVAATKPNDHVVQSNAQTFRGTAHMLHALSLELTRVEARDADLRAKLQRIVNLNVRGASEAIGAADWKAVVEELQALAQEALTPGAMLKSRKPRADPNRDIPRR